MEIIAKRFPVLLVGNFLSSSLGTRGVCEDLAAELGRVGWPVLTTSGKPGRVLRLLDMLSTVLRQRHRYDVAQVDVYSGMAFIWAEVISGALRLAGKPYILSLHGGRLPQFARRWPRRVRRVLQGASTVTAPSQYLLQEMRAFGADVLLPNPVPLSAYQFRLRTQPQPKLLWLRAFHEIYNPSLAPRAFALVCKSFPEAELAMIGPDKGDGSLQRARQTAGDLGVINQIGFPGGVMKSEVPGVLDQADIFLNTTNADNTPVTILEAMAAGLCIISTNVGGLPYLLEHERDALLVPPDDPAAVAHAVYRIMTEKNLAAELSRNARQKAERFDWSTVLPRWEQLLCAAAADKC